MIRTAIFAGGCFWCTEAIFKRLRGVESVVPGYAGGQVENPSYEEVSNGTTGHAEAIEITFDDSQISYETLLVIFWHTHDPTTVNQQGNDVGPQYRSVVFYRTDEEKSIAEKVKGNLEDEKVFAKPIVTEIVPFSNFFPAEDYHRDYYDKNKSAGYCSVVIIPKITKLLRDYGGDIKDEFRGESI